MVANFTFYFVKYRKYTFYNFEKAHYFPKSSLDYTFFEWLLWKTSWLTIHHHHLHVVLVARIFLTLSRHFSQSFIPFGRSSGLHPVSSHSCWMYVRAGRPAFARPYVGVHKSYEFTYEFVPASPAVSCMSGSSNLNSFRDWRQVAVQLVSCGGVAARTCSTLLQNNCPYLNWRMTYWNINEKVNI